MLHDGSAYLIPRSAANADFALTLWIDPTPPRREPATVWARRFRLHDGSLVDRMPIRVFGMERTTQVAAARSSSGAFVIAMDSFPGAPRLSFRRIASEGAVSSVPGSTLDTGGFVSDLVFDCGPSACLAAFRSLELSSCRTSTLGRVLNGPDVLGSSADVPHAVRHYGASFILVSVESFDRVLLRRVRASDGQVEGAPLEVVASTQPGDRLLNAGLSVLGDEAVVSWVDEGSLEVRAQRVDLTTLTLVRTWASIAGPPAYAQSIGNDGGQYLLAWEDGRSVPHEIYVRTLSSTLVVNQGPVATGGLLATSASGFSKASPAIASSTTALYLTWEDGQASPGPVLAGERVLVEPVVAFPEPPGIISKTVNRQQLPSTACDEGGCLSTWLDRRRDGSDASSYELRGALIPRGGTAGTSFLLSFPVAERRAGLAKSGATYYVAWEVSEQVRGMLLRAEDGAPLSPAATLFGVLGNSRMPAVAGAGGRYLVVWLDSSGSRSVLAQRVDAATGRPLDANPIVISASADLDAPAVTCGADNCMVAYVDRDLRVRRVRMTDGALPEPNSTIIEPLAITPTLATDGTLVLLAFGSARTEFVSSVRGQFLELASTATRSPLMEIGLGNGPYPSEPSVAYDGYRFLVAWTDKRDRRWQDRDGVDVWYARVSPLGGVLDGAPPFSGELLAGSSTVPIFINPSLSGTGRSEALAAFAVFDRDDTGEFRVATRWLSELAQGTPCDSVNAPGCPSGRCIDGVCCATACQGRCRACSIAAGGQADGVCSPRTGQICRPAVGLCDLPESCVGTSTVCPPDNLVPAGTSCRLSRAPSCDPEERCMGTTALCPPDEISVGCLDASTPDAGSEPDVTTRDSGGEADASSDASGAFDAGESNDGDLPLADTLDAREGPPDVATATSSDATRGEVGPGLGDSSSGARLSSEACGCSQVPEGPPQPHGVALLALVWVLARRAGLLGSRRRCRREDPAAPLSAAHLLTAGLVLCLVACSAPPSSDLDGGTNFCGADPSDVPGQELQRSQGVEALVAKQAWPRGLLLVDKYLYWANYRIDGVVQRTDLGGCTTEVLAAGQYDPQQLATDGTSLYWVTGMGELLRLQLETSASSVLAADANPGSALVFLDGKIFSAGANCELRVLLPGGSRHEVVGATEPGRGGTALLKGRDIYYSCSGPARLFVLHVDSNQTQLVLQRPTEVTALLAWGNGLAWSERGCASLSAACGGLIEPGCCPGRIMQLDPRSGVTSTLAVDAASAAVSMGASGDWLYWSNTSEIRRTQTASGTDRLVVQYQGFVDGIAFGDEYVYWANPNRRVDMVDEDGTINRRMRYH